MGRLPQRNLGAGVYRIYNRCANNLWILDSPECKDKFLELNIARYILQAKTLIFHFLIIRRTKCYG